MRRAPGSPEPAQRWLALTLMQCSPESRGSCAVLADRGHLLTENRNGLGVSTLTTRAYGSAERDAALLMAEGLPGETGHPLRGTHKKMNEKDEQELGTFVRLKHHSHGLKNQHLG
jgi:hypothetical protein